jgi:acetyl esterase/lipase
MKTQRPDHIQIFILISLFLLTSNNTANAQGRVDKDTVYGILSGLSLTMDIYYPAESNHRGVILIPGSAWDGQESGYTDWQVKAGYDYINALRGSIVEAGFTVFMPNHRMAPKYKYPAAVDDARRAVRFIRHHAAAFSIEANSLGAVGHSSGGHLVGMLGVLDDDPELQKSQHAVERESSRVQAVVTIAAIHDLTVNSQILWPFTASFMGCRSEHSHACDAG